MKITVIEFDKRGCTEASAQLMDAVGSELDAEIVMIRPFLWAIKAPSQKSQGGSKKRRWTSPRF